MKLHRFVLWFILLFIVQGCTASPEATVDVHIQESDTPTINAATPTVPPTVFVSATDAPTVTPSMFITNTPLATPALDKTLQPACFTMFPALPKTKIYHGKIVFFGDLIIENIQNTYSLASLYNLNTRHTMPMDPEKVNNIQVSPDGLKYAVSTAAEKKVKIYSTNGQLIRSLPLGKYPYGLDHWLNNEQIALIILQPWVETYYKYPIDQVIFNPFTGKQNLMLSEQYPDIDLANARMYWEGSSTTKYDPLLTRVVYPAGINKDYLGRSGMGYVLWDLENHIKRVEIATGYFSVTPKWAPEGSRFVINDNYGDGEFYAVTRDGMVTQLSHLNQNLAAESARRRGYFSDLYSWSPDGRYLAFWRESLKNSSIQGTFAVLDTDTGLVTDTCISAGFVGKGASGLFSVYLSPIWSPDGKYLVTEANRQEDGDYQTVLIDLEGKFAATLGDNIFPVGWLADGGN